MWSRRGLLGEEGTGDKKVVKEWGRLDDKGYDGGKTTRTGEDSSK